MKFRQVLLIVAILFALSGCAAKSSAAAGGGVEPAWEGPVLISEAQIPEGVAFRVLGEVQAKEYSGYDSVVKLYPLLASKAKKMGANAVVNVRGARRVTATSWSAPQVSGTAVKVEDLQALKGLPGTYY